MPRSPASPAEPAAHEWRSQELLLTEVMRGVGRRLVRTGRWRHHFSARYWPAALAAANKLLRTLQEGTVQRLGGQRGKRIDVRLVAATHRKLEKEARRGTFRRDLFYRPFVIPIRLPSLRERPEDIALLALHFLNRANQAQQRNVNFAPDALAQLARQAWPGNIRELGNVVQRVVLLTETTGVSAAELLPDTSRAAERAPRRRCRRPPKGMSKVTK